MVDSLGRECRDLGQGVLIKSLSRERAESQGQQILSTWIVKSRLCKDVNTGYNSDQLQCRASKANIPRAVNGRLSRGKLGTAAAVSGWKAGDGTQKAVFQSLWWRGHETSRIGKVPELPCLSLARLWPKGKFQDQLIDRSGLSYLSRQYIVIKIPPIF